MVFVRSVSATPNSLIPTCDAAGRKGCLDQDARPIGLLLRAQGEQEVVHVDQYLNARSAQGGCEDSTHVLPNWGSSSSQRAATRARTPRSATSGLCGGGGDGGGGEEPAAGAGGTREEKGAKWRWICMKKWLEDRPPPAGKPNSLRGAKASAAARVVDGVIGGRREVTREKLAASRVDWKRLPRRRPKGDSLPSGGARASPPHLRSGWGLDGDLVHRAASLPCPGPVHVEPKATGALRSRILSVAVTPSHRTLPDPVKCTPAAVYRWLSQAVKVEFGRDFRPLTLAPRQVHPSEIPFILADQDKGRRAGAYVDLAPGGSRFLSRSRVVCTPAAGKSCMVHALCASEPFTWSLQRRENSWKAS
jgi:hypothetical protein